MKINVLFSGIDVNDSLCNAYFPLSTSLKGLTKKLQTSYPDVGKTIDIYTDDTAIMYVEEASGSPIRSNRSENHDQFGKLSKQKFTDEILYKKSTKGEKNSRMCQSAISISSISSNETEYNKPLFMNSFTGILPDVRSPDSIKFDIEKKEKILEKMLNLDKVEIPDITLFNKIPPDIENHLENDNITASNENDIVEKVDTPAYKNSHINLIEKEKSFTINHDKKTVYRSKPSALEDFLAQEPKVLRQEPLITVPS